MIGDSEQICITIGRLDKLESDSKELKRAKDFITRLQAENAVIKDELKGMKAFQQKTYLDVLHSIFVSGNVQKKWAVKYLANKLGTSTAKSIQEGR